MYFADSKREKIATKEDIVFKKNSEMNTLRDRTFISLDRYLMFQDVPHRHK